MNLGWRKKITAIVLVAVLFCGYGTAYGASLEELLQQTKEKLTNTKKKTNDKKTEVKSYVQEVKALDSDISRKNREINNLSAQMELALASLSKNEQELEQTEEELLVCTKELHSRVRGMYENGTVDYLEVLLASRDFGDFLNRYELLKRVVNRDAGVVKDIEILKQDLSQKKLALENQKNSISQLMRKQKAARMDLASRHAAKREVMNVAKQDLNKYQSEVKKLEAEEEALIQQIIQQNSGQQPEATGDYMWPLSGYRTLSSPFGSRIHPILKTRRWHAGLDIPAPTGTTVMATQSGEVIDVRTMSGYGKVVMIDHGGEIISLYAHMSEQLVRNGVIVNKGQAIGRVGSTGMSTGPHLHFEMRKNQKAVDPRNYVK